MSAKRSFIKQLPPTSKEPRFCFNRTYNQLIIPSKKRANCKSLSVLKLENPWKHQEVTFGVPNFQNCSKHELFSKGIVILKLSSLALEYERKSLGQIEKMLNQSRSRLSQSSSRITPVDLIYKTEERPKFKLPISPDPKIELSEIKVIPQFISLEKWSNLQWKQRDNNWQTGYGRFFKIKN